jgi:hypothetical protein
MCCQMCSRWLENTGVYSTQLRDFATNCHQYCGLMGTLSKGKRRGPLVRCKETMAEGVLCQLRCRVKIELRHDLRFVKLDGLR